MYTLPNEPLFYSLLPKNCSFNQKTKIKKNNTPNNTVIKKAYFHELVKLRKKPLLRIANSVIYTEKIKYNTEVHISITPAEPASQYPQEKIKLLNEKTSKTNEIKKYNNPFILVSHTWVSSSEINYFTLIRLKKVYWIK